MCEDRTFNASALGGDNRWWSNLFDSGVWYAFHTQSYFDDMTAFGAVYDTELTLDNAGWVAIRQSRQAGLVAQYSARLRRHA